MVVYVCFFFFCDFLECGEYGYVFLFCFSSVVVGILGFL